MSTGKFTGIYVRVSTVGQSLENQLPDLYRWARANDLEVPPDDRWLRELKPYESKNVVWYPDKFTGKVMVRPGMSQLMAAFQAGNVSRIVVWRLDRFARRASGLSTFFDECVERGVSVVSLREMFDLGTPAGRLFANMLASFAQFESESMKQRQAARYEVDRQRQEQAHELAGRGLDPEAIARRLNLAVGVVEKMLSRPAGKMWYGGRKPGSGRKEQCSTQKVDQLLRTGLSVNDVAAVTKVSRRTVYRRLKELQVSAAEQAYMPESA